jgi:prepilin-type N-terminal cleavage/methylation domain-containing protein
MTLIEVLAALAILGVVLVSIVTCRARYVHQFSLARAKLEAIAAIDQLFAQARQKQGPFDVSATGAIPGHPEWILRRTVMVDDPDGLEGFQVVRLSVQPIELPGHDIVAIDLVVPQPRRTTSTAKSAQRESDAKR